MPHVTFVCPCVGRSVEAPRSWQMQPLAIGVLSSLTPQQWQKSFYDDRLESIDYNQPTDLAAISIETFTARRGYQIAQEYRRRGVPVVMGGYHATFCPEEVLEHADAVCVGEAEGIWHKILHDATTGQLSGVYSGYPLSDLKGVTVDHDIFREKNYFKIALVETGRGCRFHCSFCSVTNFHKATYRRRPIDEIVDEIRQLNEKIIFLVDDNVTTDVNSAKKLFQALKPLGIRWISQASVVIGTDARLLDLMAESGCMGLQIGFESLNQENLTYMGKMINRPEGYGQVVRTLRERGILIYGNFMFGLPNDSPEVFRDTVRFATEQKLFLAAFNHVIPYPGTPMYETLKSEGRLMYDKWWLSESYRFGQGAFYPIGMSLSELDSYCYKARRDFFSLSSILQRSLDLKANCANFHSAALFYYLNILLRRELTRKRVLSLGVSEGDGTIRGSNTPSSHRV